MSFLVRLCSFKDLRYKMPFASHSLFSRSSPSCLKSVFLCAILRVIVHDGCFKIMLLWLLTGNWLSYHRYFIFGKNCLGLIIINIYEKTSFVGLQYCWVCCTQLIMSFYYQIVSVLAIIGGGFVIGYAEVLQNSTESEGGKQMTNDERDISLTSKGFFFTIQNFGHFLR